MTGYQQVSTSVDARSAAVELSRSAVQARLAACGQVVGPITSTYWWDGEVQAAEEWLVLFKTTEDRAEALIEHLRAAHPYDVPEVICTSITGGNPAYLTWIQQETHRQQPRSAP